MSRAAWVVRLSPGHAGPAAVLRLHPGVEACEAGGAVWLRGPAGGADLEPVLQTLPGAERFETGASGELRRRGERVPCGTMPEGEWIPAAAWALPEAADPAPAAIEVRRVQARVARSSQELPANVLRCDLRAFTSWATGAPAIRIRPLAFAASDVEATVRGAPLPPIPGKLYHEDGGIAVPLGWALLPALGATAWRGTLRLLEGDLALFAEDASWERVPGSAFVRASRGAARASLRP